MIVWSTLLPNIFDYLVYKIVGIHNYLEYMIVWYTWLPDIHDCVAFNENGPF